LFGFPRGKLPEFIFKFDSFRLNRKFAFFVADKSFIQFHEKYQ